MNLPDSVEIVEVSPRDGLQDESTPVATLDKIELINRLIEAGAKRIEAASFVNPARVPQMADAEAVLDGVDRRPDTRLIGLVLNERGLDRALKTSVDEINVVIAASDTFGIKNQGMTTEDTLSMWSTVSARASDAGVKATVTLSTAFGCSYEGVVPLERVLKIAARTAAAEPTELALADTIGAGVPTEVAELVSRVAIEVDVPIRCHFHNTRSAGFANAIAALEAGATALDSSLGGIGGCPFAPGASGNVATEDLVHLLERMGVRTGLDIGSLIMHARWLEGMLGHSVPGQVARAGPFPGRE